MLHDHAATVFESFCRQQHTDAARYWESDVEFDFVRPAVDDRRAVIVSEVKWKKLRESELAKTEKHMREAWQRCALSAKYPSATFEILDAVTLGKL